MLFKRAAMTRRECGGTSKGQVKFCFWYSVSCVKLVTMWKFTWAEYLCNLFCTLYTFNYKKLKKVLLHRPENDFKMHDFHNVVILFLWEK